MADQTQVSEVRRYGQHRDFEDYPVGRCRWMPDGDHVLYTDYLELLAALKGLAGDVEKVARDSFSTVDGNFHDDFRAEDPDGYAVWNAAREAIAKAEGAQ